MCVFLRWCIAQSTEVDEDDEELFKVISLEIICQNDVNHVYFTYHLLTCKWG